MDEQEGRLAPAVDLYWIPLGAGGYVVRLSGKLYEALKALVEHRPRLDLYHSALQIWLPEDRFVIECAAILNLRGEERGVVAGGAVGMSWLGRFRHFRYEIRRWVVRAQRVLDLAPSVPTPVWGRDELRTGEMWNSNSVISWLLARAGIAADSLDLQKPVCPTGTDIAHAVRSGRADCGIATRSVALAAALQFLPLTWEHFDLVMRQRDYFLPGPQLLFGFLRSAGFRERASELGGYDVDAVGEVRLVN